MKAKIILGDVRTSLAKIADASVQTVITSPPYWGLRDYGEDGQIGLEQTPDEYIDEMVNVFKEVKRVLRADGTVWLNIGDSYSSHKDCKSVPQTLAVGTNREDAHKIEKGKSVTRDTKMLKSVGLKNKDLVGIPWMLAFALRADGWYLRQDIIWAKPNPMPESTKDRCTKSHEYVFLLSKSDRYFFDNEAIKEPSVSYLSNKNEISNKDKNIKGKMNEQGVTRTTAGLSMESQFEKTKEFRNRRDVWVVPTRPFKGAHFAVMPEALVEPCILAGTPIGGCCSICGTPYERDMEIGARTKTEVREDTLNVIPGRDKPSRLQSKAMESVPKTTLGWIQNCDCVNSESAPPLVLDPFTGSGTVAVVALRNGCDFIGTELNPGYVKIAEARIIDSAPLFNEVEICK